MRTVWLMFLLGGMLLTSCQRSFLKCRTEFLTPLYLASEQIDTPDPSRKCFWGQQVVVGWKIPIKCFNKPIVLKFHARFGNREIQTFEIPITKTFGYWSLQLINREYWFKGGIITYDAELWQDGRLLEEWRHHLWTEIIEIRDDAECPN